MKTKMLLAVLLLAVFSAGYVWLVITPHPGKPAATGTKPERKILYYQSAMHPWIKSDRPGKCPICGMNLAAVYEGDAGLGMETNMVVLNSNSITAINVQTAEVVHRDFIRSLHAIGTIQKNSVNAAWFVFTVYERDFRWIQPGQRLEVRVRAVPGSRYPAEIQRYGTETFADRDFDPQTTSTRMRARILNPPVEIPGYEGKAYFNGLAAEADIRVEITNALAIPRSAILSPGGSPIAFVQLEGGAFESRQLKLGRIGDDFAEVIAGLEADERVVTHGGFLLDAEAQLKRGE